MNGEIDKEYAEFLKTGKMPYAEDGAFDIIKHLWQYHGGKFPKGKCKFLDFFSWRDRNRKTEKAKKDPRLITGADLSDPVIGGLFIDYLSALVPREMTEKLKMGVRRMRSIGTRRILSERRLK